MVSKETSLELRTGEFEREQGWSGLTPEKRLEKQAGGGILSLL